MDRRDVTGEQAGFTLLELLVTVAILGIVSGVAVFGIGRLTGDAERAACDVEARTITVAQEAHRVQFGDYADLEGLVHAGLLSERPVLYSVQLLPGGWQLVGQGACAGGADELAADGDRRAGDRNELRAHDELTAEQRVLANLDEPWDDMGAQRRLEQGRRIEQSPEGAEQLQPRPPEELGAVDQPQHVLRLHRDPQASGCGRGQVDLNHAGADELARVVHVNPGRAIQIERGRPFSSVGELRRVEGFNDQRVEDVLREGLACV